jgi:hypothetical protein
MPFRILNTSGLQVRVLICYLMSYQNYEIWFNLVLGHLPSTIVGIFITNLYFPYMMFRWNEGWIFWAKEVYVPNTVHILAGLYKKWFTTLIFHLIWYVISYSSCLWTFTVSWFNDLGLFYCTSVDRFNNSCRLCKATLIEIENHKQQQKKNNKINLIVKTQWIIIHNFI